MVGAHSKQFGERPAIFHQMERPAFAIGGMKVVDAHRVENGASDVLRANGIVGGIFGAAIAGAVNLATSDTAAGEQYRHGCRPVVAAGAVRAAGARIANARLTAHLAGDQDERFVEQASLMKVI